MNTPELIILDVGHGNAATIHENGTTVVIDAGKGSHLLEYLQQKQISTIELVILSHADQDHIAGLTNIFLNGVTVKRVVFNSDAMKTSQTWRELILIIDAFQRAGTTILNVGISTGPIQVNGLQSLSLEAVSPSSILTAFGVGARDRNNRIITTNSISSCIRISHKGNPLALLTGDMDEIALDEAIFSGAQLKAQLLVFPHHGGMSGGSQPAQFASKLMANAKPQSVMFSHGRAKHNNPAPVMVKAVLSAAPQCYIACTQLSKNCAVDLPSTRQTHLSGIFSAGAQGNQCCTGTVSIDINTGLLEAKVAAMHKSYVDMQVQSPLCRTKP